MPETLPPLTVRIDHARVVAARRRERGILVTGVVVQLTLGVLAAAGIGWLWFASLGAEGQVPEGSVLTLVFGGIVALVLLAYGFVLLRSLRTKGADYWNGAGLPDIAFVAHADGISLHNPETSGVVEIPWASVKGFDAKRLFVRLRFEPGALDPKYHNEFWFGRATLDQDAATIRRGLVALSGRDL